MTDTYMPSGGFHLFVTLCTLPGPREEAPKLGKLLVRRVIIRQD